MMGIIYGKEDKIEVARVVSKASDFNWIVTFGDFPLPNCEI